ncbi:hypothetical protein CFP56_011787 [Quercus suber]|uniref:Uncharacterized protein n=1 Tax=Quercus suber TaxID=58331 RepID=A0AAW0KZB8_QUESU
MVSFKVKPHTCSPQSISSFQKITTHSASLPPWPSLVFFWRLASVATNHDINMCPFTTIVKLPMPPPSPFQESMAYG